MRWPKTNVGKLVAALGLLVAGGVIAAVAFVGWLVITFPGFPSDASGPVPGPVTAQTVYDDVAGFAGGDERHAGAAYRCRLRGVKPRTYRCVVPGHGAGDLAYRVTVSRTTSCWRARGDAPPADGCITVPGGNGAGLD